MKNASRIFRGPLLWILLAIIAIITVLNLTSSMAGAKDIPTSQAVSMINGNDKLKEVVLTDGDQTIQITNAKGEQFRSHWVGDQSDKIIDRLNQRVENKTITTWRGENPGPSVWK